MTMSKINLKFSNKQEFLFSFQSLDTKTIEITGIKFNKRNVISSLNILHDKIFKNYFQQM